MNLTEFNLQHLKRTMHFVDCLLLFGFVAFSSAHSFGPIFGVYTKILLALCFCVTEFGLCMFFPSLCFKAQAKKYTHKIQMTHCAIVRRCFTVLFT